MEAKTLFVIGASEGGVQGLQTLLADLPTNFPAAVLLVLHIGAHKSNLPWLLNQRGPLPATHPIDGDFIEAGHVYVAPRTITWSWS